MFQIFEHIILLLNIVLQFFDLSFLVFHILYLWPQFSELFHKWYCVYPIIQILATIIILISFVVLIFIWIFLNSLRSNWCYQRLSVSLYNAWYFCVCVVNCILAEKFQGHLCSVLNCFSSFCCFLNTSNLFFHFTLWNR